ncbi:MAG: (d)CMP kinase [Bacteroidales bacterium]|jgi:cytidylate kinase
MKKIIIAIDGHSSTGKSTFAKAIAKVMDYTYLDSGALYRAVTLYALDHGWTDPDGKPNVQAIVDHLKDIRLTFKKDPVTGQNRTHMNGEDVEEHIRSMEVSRHVSPVSEIPVVRDFVDLQLRKWGEKKGIVMDGRDIGTAVFPQAELKIFMTAPAEIRADRRLRELQEKGMDATFAEVLSNVRQRDYLDSHRETHPLVKAPDALLLDNGRMSVEEQMDWFKKIMEEKWGIRLK